MLKYVVAMLCGVSLSGSVYMAGWGSNKMPHLEAGEVCTDCCSPSSESTASIDMNLIDVKNTKCVVMGDDLGDSKQTVSYKGKSYHICCSDCVKDFNKEPEKYVKALEANPTKFGLK